MGCFLTVNRPERKADPHHRLVPGLGMRGPDHYTHYMPSWCALSKAGIALRQSNSKDAWIQIVSVPASRRTEVSHLRLTEQLNIVMQNCYMMCRNTKRVRFTDFKPLNRPTQHTVIVPTSQQTLKFNITTAHLLMLLGK